MSEGPIVTTWWGARGATIEGGDVTERAHKPQNYGYPVPQPGPIHAQAGSQPNRPQDQTWGITTVLKAATGSPDPNNATELFDGVLPSGAKIFASYPDFSIFGSYPVDAFYGLQTISYVGGARTARITIVPWWGCCFALPAGRVRVSAFNAEPTARAIAVGIALGAPVREWVLTGDNPVTIGAGVEKVFNPMPYARRGAFTLTQGAGFTLPKSNSIAPTSTGLVLPATEWSVTSGPGTVVVTAAWEVLF